MAGGGGEALTHLRCRQRGCAACPWCCCSASAAPTSGHLAGPRAAALGYFWGAGGCTGGGDGYPWGGTKNCAPLSPHTDPHVPVCAGAFHSIGGAQPLHAGVGQGGGVGGFQETPWSRGARSGHGRPPGRRGGRTAGILGFGCAQAPLQQAELLRRQHPQQVPAARGQGQPRVTSPLPPRGGTRVPAPLFAPIPDLLQKVVEGAEHPRHLLGAALQAEGTLRVDEEAAAEGTACDMGTRGGCWHGAPPGTPSAGGCTHLMMARRGMVNISSGS